MRSRSLLFGELVPITPGQPSSCLVPPENPVSELVFSASVSPVNCQPATVLAAFRNGGMPVQDTGLKPFQSIVESTTRLASSSSKPAAVPIGPTAKTGAVIKNVSAAARSTAMLPPLHKDRVRRRWKRAAFKDTNGLRVNDSSPLRYASIVAAGAATCGLFET